jgi:hypothetical protein
MVVASAGLRSLRGPHTQDDRDRGGSARACLAAEILKGFLFRTRPTVLLPADDLIQEKEIIENYRFFEECVTVRTVRRVRHPGFGTVRCRIWRDLWQIDFLANTAVGGLGQGRLSRHQPIAARHH